MRALDLYAGAGGATRGLQLAGFDDVVAVDINPQPHNPADRFIQADALSLSLAFLQSFDYIHASPPCQAHSSMRVLHNAKQHVDLIGPTRELLIAAGVPYAIENVVGAPLINPTLLCGTMFALATPCGAELQRHRGFETSFFVLAPPCRHKPGARTIGIYGGHYRNRRRPTGSNHVPKTDFSAADARAAMGVDWPMTGDEISQAIPPSYSEFIARAWLATPGLRSPKSPPSGVGLPRRPSFDDELDRERRTHKAQEARRTHRQGNDPSRRRSPPTASRRRSSGAEGSRP